MSQFQCNDALRQTIAANLTQFPFQSGELQADKRAAAVAITIVHMPHQPTVYGIPVNAGCESEAAVLITRRSLQLKKHAGQWALPGGRIEAGETPEETALREMAEEVGLELGRERIIGRLDDYTTRSGFTIKPVVVWGGHVGKLQPNPAEVQSIHRIPWRSCCATMRPSSKASPKANTPSC